MSPFAPSKGRSLNHEKNHRLKNADPKNSPFSHTPVRSRFPITNAVIAEIELGSGVTDTLPKLWVKKATSIRGLSNVAPVLVAWFGGSEFWS